MIQWPSFTFPPLNLWNMPYQSELLALVTQLYYEQQPELWEDFLNA